MMRRTLWALVVVAATGVGRPESAHAARKQHCTIEPTGQAEVLGLVYGADNRQEIMARWPGMVACQAPSPLDGAAVVVRQVLRLRPLGHQMFGGPTRIVIDAISEGFHAAFDGQSRGLFDIFPELLLEVHASGNGDGKLQLQEAITYDPDSGDIVLFEPSHILIDVTSAG